MSMWQSFISIILEVIATAIVSIIVENKFRVVQRIKKIFIYILNKQVSLKPVFTIKTQKNPKEIGKEISQIWKNNGLNVRITKDSDNFYAMTNGVYNIDLANTENGIIFQTSVLDAPIREVSEKFSKIMKILEELKSIELKEIFLSVNLPYKFEFVEIKPTSFLEVYDYDIKLRNDEWKSQLSLKLKNKSQELHISSEYTSEIYTIIKKLFRPF